MMNFEEIWKRVKENTDLETQKELADFLGVMPQFVTKKKRNNEFNAEWVFKIGDQYNLCPNWIITGQEKCISSSKFNESLIDHH